MIHDTKILKRSFFLFLGLVLMGFGISLVTKSSLGTPPISSMAYVLSLILPLTFGELTFIFSLIFLLAEIILLGKEFPHQQYLQVLVAMFFGFFVDLGMIIFSPVHPEMYPDKILVLLSGCFVLALGIFLQVSAHLLLNPGEGVVQTIALKTRVRFGVVKIIFDSVLVSGAIIISLAYFGSIEGLREGTIISAGLVGYMVILIGKASQRIHFQEWLAQ